MGGSLELTGGRIAGWHNFLYPELFTAFGLPARLEGSVGEHRHRQARVAAEQHGPGDRGRAEPVADVVERGVEGAAASPVERQRELDGAVVVEVADRDADQREALRSRSSAGAVASSAASAARIVAVCAVGPGSVCERVAREKSSKRSRSTTVRPTRPAARMRRVTRSTRPTSVASMVAGRRRRPAERALRRRSSAAAGPTCTGRGSRLWASAWRWRPDARPSMATSVASASWATSPTVVIPRSCSLAAVTGPTPQSRSTGERVEEGQLAVGRHHQQAVGLGHAARHLGQELGAGDADGDGQADPLEHVARAAASAISTGVPETRRRPPTSRNASSIDSPSTSGVVSSNTSNTALLASE